MVRSLLPVLVLAAVACPAAAQEDPALNAAQQCYSLPFRVTTEQRTMLCEALNSRDLTDDEAARRIDRALAAIPGPGPENAFLLAAKAQLLLRSGEDDAALQQFESTLARYRNLPPLLAMAASALAYSTHADRAAEYWLALIRAAPEVSATIGDHVLFEIERRLRANGQEDLVDRLASALQQSGYMAQSVVARSELAAKRLDTALAAGNLAAAREALGQIQSPDTYAAMLANDRYRPLWPDIPYRTEDAQEQAWREWIAALAAEAERDAMAGGSAISFLNSFVEPSRLIKAYEPRVRSVLVPGRQDRRLFDYAYWVAPLATAHVLAGDPEGAISLLTRAAEVLAAMRNPARFNADANLAVVLVDAGRPAEGLAVIDRTISELAAMDAGNTALLPMHAVRVRALVALDREAEAWSSLQRLRGAAAPDLPLVLSTLLQIGHYDEARDLLVESLRSLDDPAAALTFLQHSPASYRKPTTIALEEQKDRLRTDPEVILALDGKGRIVPRDPIAFDNFPLPALGAS